MIVSKGNMIVSMIQVVTNVVVFLVIAFLINKFVLKKSLKDMWKTAIIVWIIILLVNTIFVITNTPFAIGLPDQGDLSGVTTKYHSLGYSITVEEPLLFNVDNNIEVYFSTWW